MTPPVPTDQNAETQEIGEAALRHVVGFTPSVAVRLAAAGYDVSSWWPVVDPGVAS